MSSHLKQKSRAIPGAFSRLKAFAKPPAVVKSIQNLAAASILLAGAILANFALYDFPQNALHAQTVATNSVPASSQKVDAGLANPPLTLSDQDKAHIRAEEIFRDEVRRQIEADSAKKSAQDNLWSILNSSFAVWFLSSVVVAGITAAFAKYQKSHSARAQKNDIQRRLQTEIGSRIAEGLIAMRLEIKRIDNGQTYWASDMYREALFYLDNEVRDNTTVLDFSIYPEYRFRKLRSLIFELAAVSEKSASTQLSATREGYTKLIDLVDTTPMGEDYSKSPDMSATLDAVKKAIEILEGLQANSLWQTQQ